MKPPITRRGFMAGASAVALAAGFPPLAGAQQAVTVDQFLAISSRLTQAATTDLDTTMAAKLLDGFIAMGRGIGARACSPTMPRSAPARWRTTSSLPGIPASTTRRPVRRLPASTKRCCGTRSISPSRRAPAAARPAIGRIPRRADEDSGNGRHRSGCDRRRLRHLRSAAGGEALGRRGEGRHPGGRRRGRSGRCDATLLGRR